MLPLFLLLVLIPTPASSVFFNFTAFDQGLVGGCDSSGSGSGSGGAPGRICLEGDAIVRESGVELTKNALGVPVNNSIGRMYYSQPVLLYNNATGRVTDFTSHFSFMIDSLNRPRYGEGIAFYLYPYGSGVAIPSDSYGGGLGIFGGGGDIPAGLAVAVEFDSFSDPWDPLVQGGNNMTDHVGIDVGSAKSNSTVIWKSGIRKGKVANAWVTYDSKIGNLSVFLTYADNPSFNGSSSLTFPVNLREHLSEQVVVGFSASTGSSFEVHKILSWDFNSTLDVQNGKRKAIAGLAIGLGVAGAVTAVAFMVVAVRFVAGRRRKSASGIVGGGKRNTGKSGKSGIAVEDHSFGGDFQSGMGPKRFTYKELARATNNFSEEGRLGQGGFGAVYKGVLPAGSLDAEVAIKRISKGSRQGMKEYKSEVTIISRLRHRNLVPLLGYCHDTEGELVLVYEFMPNASLDTHLFFRQDGGYQKQQQQSKHLPLPWPVRYRVATGLASALLYLHEEWEQCVVHRDVKSSNVMLDAGFNARLGDFGLARLVDHDRPGSQTTVLAGTMGYMAPECVMSGRASKESDVYSFGVVALEIACGRRAVEPKEEERKVGLVEWVWSLYASGGGFIGMLDAVDARLDGEYDKDQMLRLMTVGLWCANPDVKHRPPIRQVVATLAMESPLPTLPHQMPVAAAFFAPPLTMGHFSYVSSYAGATSPGSTACTTSGSATIIASSTAVAGALISMTSTRGSSSNSLSPSATLLYAPRTA